ncbi:MAG: hypothetical protein IJV69_02570 [Kiritimatiellae bacterium]|nr:hypothetical protein [Kiritimatiellia bacterium]
MRNFNVPHTARWVAVCFSFFVGSLILQGCGEGAPSPEADPYAELDAAFPEGLTAASAVAGRAQDKAYMAEITAGAEKFSSLSAKVAELDRSLEHIRTELAKSLSLRMGETIPDELLEDELAKYPPYQTLLEKRSAAAAEAEAQRLANMAVIRDRMNADNERYNALLAEADAKAKAAGLPTRAEAAAAKKTSSAPAEKPVLNAPTVEDLAKKTGIPLAPAKAADGQ